MLLIALALESAKSSFCAMIDEMTTTRKKQTQHNNEAHSKNLNYLLPTERKKKSHTHTLD